MTLAEYREQVTKCFKEKQTVQLRIIGVGQAPTRTITGRIEKFYPNHVSVRHDGYLESFPYSEFLMIAKPNTPKKSIVAAVGYN